MLNISAVCSMLIGMFAAPAPAPDVEAWFLRQWNEARAFPEGLSQPLRFSYQIRQVYVPSAEQLAAMRSQVEGKPDHPLRQELAQYERRARGEFTGYTYEAIVGGPELWRLSREHDSPGRYVDIGRDGAAAWCLTSGQLNIVDTTSSPDGYDYAQSGNDIALAARLLLFQGIGIGAASEPLSPPVVSMRGSNWTAVVSHEGWVYEYEGVWDESTQTGTVQSWRVVASDISPSSVGEQFVFADHRIGTTALDRVASRATYHRPSGAVESEYTLTAVADVTREAVASMVELPSLGRDDPKRGKLTVGAIYDHRPNAPSWVRSPETGQLERALSPTKRYGFLRTVGWALLIGLVATVVALRVTRASRASVSSASHTP